MIVGLAVAVIAGVEKFKKHTRQIQLKHRREEIVLVINYQLDDEQLFHIKEITTQLRHQKGINRVFLAKGGVIGEKVLRKCDAVLLFCTPSESKSLEARSTWDVAFRARLPVIPVFARQEDIPVLLSPMQGIEFKATDMPGTMKAIHDVISTIVERRHSSTENAPSEREKKD